MNIDISKKYKVGDIISPKQNGSNVWYKISRWAVVVKVSNTKRLRFTRNFYIYEIAELYAEIVKLKEKIK